VLVSARGWCVAGRRCSICPAAVHSRLANSPTTDNDWYLNLLWIDRQKCILLAHTDTLFSVFRAGVRRADLRPIGNYLVAAVESELRAENLPTDTFSQLQPDTVQLAKTASRSTPSAS
jgi:hypothetical protein